MCFSVVFLSLCCDLNMFLHLSVLHHSASDTGGHTAEDKKDELKAERGRMICGGTLSETRDEGPGSGCPSSTAQAQQEASAPRLFSPAAAFDKAPPIPERLPVTPTSQKKSPSTAPAFSQTLEKLLASPQPQEKSPSTTPATSASPENPRASPLSHKEKSPGTVPFTMDVRNSTQEGGEAASKQHMTKAEPADQRTEPPLSE